MDLDSALSRNSEWFATRGQHPEAPRTAERGGDQRPHPVEDVLAVVQHQQDVRGLHRTENGLEEFFTGNGLGAECVDRGTGDIGGLMRSCRQVHEANAVGKSLSQHCCQTHRETGLADPGRSPQRHEAVVGQQPCELFDFVVAADQRDVVVRQCACTLGDRP